MIVHQIGLDSDAKENAAAHVLASMLNGPAFNFLRTKEKLGYSVRMTKESTYGVSHISIFIQSTKYDPDYCESKINQFFIEHFEKYQKGCLVSVESNKESIINHLQQKPKNLKERATYDMA